MKPLPNDLKTWIIFAVSGAILGLVVSLFSPYGDTIGYVATGLFLGLILCAWAVFPGEDPGDWRSGFWRVGKESPGRVPELDALRALAALAVLGFHLWPEAFHEGWAGVDLFFVLSGYLITDIILQYGGNRSFLVSFYARRCLRIWPIYYLTLLAVVASYPWMPAGFTLEGLPSALTFTMTTLTSATPRTDAVSIVYRHFGHAWSVSVEEQFYLLWPALVLIVGRRGLPGLVACCVVLAMVARERGLGQCTLITRGDGLALGGLAAAVLSDRARTRAFLGKYRLGFALVAALALAYLTTTLWSHGRDSLSFPPRSPRMILALDLLFFGMVGLAACSMGHPALAALRDRRLCYVGKISYGLYLYHILIFDLIKGVASGPGPFGSFGLDLLKLAATFGLAMFTWEYVEQPILAFKRRFPYAPAPATLNVRAGVMNDA
jgi:peptidoglycan/LPS O-acetylase OafA/YrhL